MSTGIYGIVHRESGRCYVGSSGDIGRRFAQHRYALNRLRHDNQHLQRAWNKYGAHAFDFTVLECISDASLLSVNEQRWLEAKAPLVYNVGRVVQSPWLGVKRPPFSAEHRRRMSAAKQGKRVYVSEEGKARRRAGLLTAEVSQRISEAVRRGYVNGTRSAGPGRAPGSLSPEERTGLAERLTQFNRCRKGAQQSPEQVAKRVAARRATIARKKAEAA